MISYDLHDTQKELLRKMVGLVDLGLSPHFSVFHNAKFQGLVFEGSGGRREDLECNLNDIAELSWQGLVQLQNRSAGSVRQRGIDAVHANFLQRESPLSGNTYNVTAGNIASLQQGDGNHAHVQQNIRHEQAEALSLVHKCQSLLNSVDEVSRPHIDEALNDLKHELSEQTPKQSRLLAYIGIATKYGVAGTAFATVFHQLCEAIHNLF